MTAEEGDIFIRKIQMLSTMKRCTRLDKKNNKDKKTETKYINKC